MLSLLLPEAKELAYETVKALGKNYACLLANHGVVAGAQTLDRAFMVASIVEEGAHVYYLERQSNKISTVPKQAYEAVFKSNATIRKIKGALKYEYFNSRKTA